MSAGSAAVARFIQHEIEQVKESADIVEVVSAYTDLRRAGQRFTGLCPFHDERTPSFSVDPREKLYHCFGCGVGGDVIKFVEEKEGLAFAEAVEALAERYGVEIEREEEDPRAEEARRRRARLGEVLERTAALLRELPVGGGRGAQGARVPGLARAGRGGAARVRRRLRAERMGHGAQARPEREVLDRGAATRPGCWCENKQGNPYDRFRVADHVPDARRAGARAGVRRAGDDAPTRSRST